MVVLAETDRALDRLTAPQIDAIVEGTDEVLDFLADVPEDGLSAPAAAADAPTVAGRAFFCCVGGRGQIDDAAASIIAFALREDGLEARSLRRGDDATGDAKEGAITIALICYASHPSEAVQRYTLRKLRAGGTGLARHAVIDYDVAPAPSVSIAGGAGPRDTLVGDIAAICRLAAQHAVAVVPSASATHRQA